jgi:hypothetical protein
MARSGKEAPRNLEISLELWSAIIVYADSTHKLKDARGVLRLRAKAQFHVTFAKKRLVATDAHAGP